MSDRLTAFWGIGDVINWIAFGEIGLDQSWHDRRSGRLTRRALKTVNREKVGAVSWIDSVKLAAARAELRRTESVFQSSLETAQRVAFAAALRHEIEFIGRPSAHCDPQTIPHAIFSEPLFVDIEGDTIDIDGDAVDADGDPIVTIARAQRFRKWADVKADPDVVKRLWPNPIADSREMPTYATKPKPSRRTNTESDLERFFTWFEEQSVSDGVAPTKEQCEQWAINQRLGRQWARDARKQLPPSRKRAAGPPRKRAK